MTQDTQPLTCFYHPKVETSLRCSQCGKPICSKCAIHTPVGYKCPDCVKAQQKKFNTAKWFDYPLGFLVAAVLSYLGSIFADKLGFFTIFLAPLAGTAIVKASRFITHNRRSKKLFLTITIGAFLGSLPGFIFYLLVFIIGIHQQPADNLTILLPLIWRGVYIVLVPSTIYPQISGLIIKQ